jgi:hypothetical protein
LDEIGNSIDTIGFTKPKKTARELDQMAAAPLIGVMGVVCVTTLFIGLGFVVPVSSAVGDLFVLFAVAAGMFVIGLLDDG